MSTARVLTVAELLAIVLDFVVEDGYDDGFEAACDALDNMIGSDAPGNGVAQDAAASAGGVAQNAAANNGNPSTANTHLVSY